MPLSLPFTPCRPDSTAPSDNQSISPVDSEVIVLDSSSSDDAEDDDEGEQARASSEEEVEEEKDQLGDHEEEDEDNDDDVRGQARTGSNEPATYSRSRSRDFDSAADQENNDIGLGKSWDVNEPVTRKEEEEEREGDATFALLEMHQVDRAAGRTPLFLQRGTASVSTSEADAEELFQRFDEDEDGDEGTRGHGQDEPLDEDMDEIEGDDHRQQEERVAGYAARSLYSTAVDQSYPLLENATAAGEEGDGEDVYDVDALGEGIEEEEKNLAASQQHEQGDQAAFGSMSPVVVVANTESMDASPAPSSSSVDMIEMDRGEPEPELEEDDDDDDDDDEVDDPSVFTDPFGRPVRYDYGGGASEEYEDFVEYEDRGDEGRGEVRGGNDLEEKEEVASVEDGGDGGNAMDPAEAEWAGRPTGAQVAAAAAEEAEIGGEEAEDGFSQPPYAEQTLAVEVLELDSFDSEGEAGRGRDPEVDGGAGDREEEDEEEEEQSASLTAQMLGDSGPEPAVESNSAAEQQQEDQLAGGDVEANGVQVAVDDTEDPMDLSNAPPTPAAVSFEPEPSAETPPPVAAATGAGATFVVAEADQFMELASTATTPALQTPAAVPDASNSYFGPSGAGEDREAVDSGALADVDEDVVMQERQPEPTSAPLSQAADAAVDLAEEVEITAALSTPPPQVALPLREPAALPSSSIAEAGVKAFEVDEANLADIEEEGADGGAEGAIEAAEAVQVQPQPDSEADSLVVTAVEGPTPADDVGMQSNGEASRSPDTQAGESAEAAGSATNPLEALYEHEDSEVGPTFRVMTSPARKLVLTAHASPTGLDQPHSVRGQGQRPSTHDAFRYRL